MKKKFLVGSVIGFVLFGLTGVSQAALITANEISTISGVDDTTATAQDLGVLSVGSEFIIDGWVSDNNYDDVDFYKFTIASTMSLFFDIDYANDIGNPNDDDTGVDSMIAVFDIIDTLLSYNDDSDVFDYDTNDPGSVPNGDYDSLIGALELSAGSYFVAVSSFGNSPLAYEENFSSSSYLSVSGELFEGAYGGSGYELNGLGETGGSYQLVISESFDAMTPVPEPNTMLLFGLGLLGFAGVSRRRKEQ